MLYAILCLFLLTNSLKLNTKFCVNCKYFIKGNTKDEYGKCSMFQKENIHFLVNGNKSNFDYYYFCTIARGNPDMCGINGKKYIKMRLKKNETNI
jgi:hypothetical protein